ncbi:hypothetical protein NMD04_16435 [Citrobacter meridianamericanus]
MQPLSESESFCEGQQKRKSEECISNRSRCFFFDLDNSLSYQLSMKIMQAKKSLLGRTGMKNNNVVKEVVPGASR